MPSSASRSQVDGLTSTAVEDAEDLVLSATLSRDRTVSDIQLLIAIADCDGQALGQFYDRHGGLVYTVALHLTHNPAQAEEIVLDVFDAVWHYAHTFQSQHDVRPWLAGITRHRAMTATRQHNQTNEP